MSRNVRRYADYTDPITRYRYRVIVLLPNTSGIALTVGVEPDFGDETGNAGWLPIPLDSILPMDSGSIEYPSKAPLGLPSTPTLDVTFDLKGLAGDTLATYLTSAVQVSGGVSYAVSSSSYTLTAATTPVVILKTDYGGTGLTIASFQTAFIGAMLRSPKRSTSYDEENDEALRTITFVSIMRAVWELIPMECLAQQALYDGNSTTNNSAKTGYYSNFYDTLYDNGSTSFGVCAATRGTSADRFRARCYSVTGLFDAIKVVTQAVLKEYMRDASITATFFSVDATNQSVAYGASSAYDYLKLFTRTYDLANTRGAEVDGGFAFHAKRDSYFIGAFWKGTATYPIDTTDLGTAYDAGNLIGGYFVPSDPASIHKFSHMYDYMVDLVGGGGCKASYDLETTGVSITFSPPGMSPSINSDRDLGPTDISTDGKGDIDEGEDAGQVRAFRASLPDGEGEDVTEVIVNAAGGSTGDGEGGVNLHFHNAPYLGSKEDFFYQDADNPISENTDFSGDYVSYGYSRYSCRRLYYFDTPLFMSTQVPILCHEDVAYATGWSSAIVGNSQSWEVFDAHGSDGDFGSKGSASGSNALIDTENLASYRARALVNQSRCGMGYAIPYAMIYSILTGFNMWITSIAVERTLGRYEYIGHRFRLVNDADVLTGLPILTPSVLDSFSSHPKIGICIGVTWDDDGLATLKLLGIPS